MAIRMPWFPEGEPLPDRPFDEKDVKIMRLEAALRFYADENHYAGLRKTGDCRYEPSPGSVEVGSESTTFRISAVEADGGRRARETIYGKDGA